MASGEHRFTVADAQEFARRGLASQAAVDALTGNVPKPLLGDTSANQQPMFRPKRLPKEPNKTEAEYGRILEAMKLRGEICDYFYEGLTLHWGKGMRYTPDYVVYDENQTLPLLIEIKGGHIWSRDAVRFKGCRAEWDKFYRFEMHQKKGGQWSRIL